MSTQDTVTAPIARSANRCEGCLTPASLWSIERIRREFPNLHLNDTGVCGRCGTRDEVYDVPNLILLRWHGVLDIGTAYPPQRLRNSDPLMPEAPKTATRIRAELMRTGFIPRATCSEGVSRGH